MSSIHVDTLAQFVPSAHTATDSIACARPLDESFAVHAGEIIGPLAAIITFVVIAEWARRTLNQHR